MIYTFTYFYKLTIGDDAGKKLQVVLVLIIETGAFPPVFAFALEVERSTWSSLATSFPTFHLFTQLICYAQNFNLYIRHHASNKLDI